MRSLCVTREALIGSSGTLPQMSRHDTTKTENWQWVHAVSNVLGEF